MFDDRSDSEAEVAGRLAVPRDEEKQIAERRWLQDALEDDEVYESLKALRTKKAKQERPPAQARHVPSNSD